MNLDNFNTFSRHMGRFQLTATPPARLDYDAIARRAVELWTRDEGSMAHDASGTPCDSAAVGAVSFTRWGAIIRATEEVVGGGQATSRVCTIVARRVPQTRTTR